MARIYYFFMYAIQLNYDHIKTVFSWFVIKPLSTSYLSPEFFDVFIAVQRRSLQWIWNIMITLQKSIKLQTNRFALICFRAKREIKISSRSFLDNCFRVCIHKPLVSYSLWSMLLMCFFSAFRSFDHLKKKLKCSHKAFLRCFGFSTILIMSELFFFFWGL